jgi:hypothetical protein
MKEIFFSSRCCKDLFLWALPLIKKDFEGKIEILKKPIRKQKGEKDLKAQNLKK